MRTGTRTTAILGVLLMAGFHTNLAAGELCWLQSYGRGVGTIPGECPAGTEKDATGALCYPKCQAGYTGVGPLCWTQNFPWTAYGRGAGYIKDGCAGGYENDAGLCYKGCGTGYNGIGPICWGYCGGEYPVACGAACAKSVDACATGIASQVLAPLEMIANIGLTVISGGAASVAKAAIKTSLQAGLKAAGKQLGEAAVESAATTMAEANLTGKFDPSSLDPIGIAQIVQAYNHPVCAQTYGPAPGSTPQSFRVVPAGVAGGKARGEGNQCEPGAWFNASDGRCYENCYGTPGRAGNSMPRKDTYYCDYGTEQPSFQPDNIDRSKLGSACSAGFQATGLWCGNGKVVEMCYGTGAQPGNYVPRNADGSCNYGSTLPVKVSQAPMSFGGKTLAYGLDPHAMTGNVLSFIGSRWSFAGINMPLDWISAGSDGTIWGLVSGGKPYTWNGSAWVPMPGQLAQISVGSAQEIWGVSATKDIFRWTGKDWTLVRGKLDMVSVGADGEVWGLANGNIFRREDDLWVVKPGALTYISVGRAGLVWGVNVQGQVWKWNGSGWNQIPGMTLGSVHVGGSGAVWGVTPGAHRSRKVYRWTGSAWAEVESGASAVAPL